MTSYTVRGTYPDDERGSVYVYAKTEDGAVTTLDPLQAFVFDEIHRAGGVQARLHEEDPAADWTTIDLHAAREAVQRATLAVHDAAILNGWSLDHRPDRFDPRTILRNGELFHAAAPGETAPLLE